MRELYTGSLIISSGHSEMQNSSAYSLLKEGFGKIIKTCGLQCIFKNIKATMISEWLNKKK